MLADEDHPLEDAIDGGGVHAEPRVVVVYRSRGIPWMLVPPLLLLAGVAAIVVYRRSGRPDESWPVRRAPAVVASTTDRGPSADPRALPAPARVEPARIDGLAEIAEATGRRPSPAPLDLASLGPRFDPTPSAEMTVPPPTDVAQAEPKPSPDPSGPAARFPASPFDPPVAPPAVRVGFDPAASPAGHEPAAADASAADPAAVAATDEADRRAKSKAIQEDLLREAERIREERDRLARAKPELLRPDPIAARRNRQELVEQDLKRIAEQRLAFHSDLRKVLKERGIHAGPDIKELRDRYGVDCAEEIMKAANRDLVGPSNRLSIAERVRRMRRWGLPETVVLDDLRLAFDDMVHGRGGPRSHDEAWVYAARLLLSIPPMPPVRGAADAPRP